MTRFLSLRFFMGLIATAALVVGPFLPLVGVRVFSDNTYWDLSKTGAIIVLVAAIVTLAVAIKGWFRAYAIIGVIVLALLAYTLREINLKRQAMERDIETGMAGTPLRSLTVGLVRSIKLDYGMGVMAGGGVLLLVAGLTTGRLSFRRTEEKPAVKNSDS